jgi:DNA-directed RNA polymerase subunit RPC12/RpoP
MQSKELVKLNSVVCRKYSGCKHSDSITCQNCGHDVFEYVSTRPIGGFSFDGYKCQACGVGIAIDRDEVYIKPKANAIYNNSKHNRLLTTK